MFVEGGVASLDSEATTGAGQSYPLTSIQEGMLFESVMADRPWANLEQIVCRLAEKVDQTHLRQAWELTHRRHAALRTSFRWHNVTDPEQVVCDDAPLRYVTHDWTAEPDPEQHLGEWLDADRRQGVALDDLTCHRLNLFLFADDQAALVWTFHHSILDGRAFTVVLEEVFSIYDSLVGQAAPLLAPPVPFAEHVKFLTERDQTTEQSYFRDLLRDFDTPVRLPISTPERADQEPTPGRHRDIETVLGEDVVDGLSSLAEATETTLYTTVLAAWALTLGRYTRRDDVVFGTTRSGRHTVDGAPEIVGCLINTVPSRVNVEPTRTIEELLRAIRDDQVAVRPHEHASLMDIQANANTPPGLPLLTTNVVFERYLLDTHLRSRGGAWRNRSFEVLEEGGFPLSLAGYLTEGLRLCLEYDQEVFEHGVIEAMLGHVTTVLTDLSNAEPHTQLHSLRLVGEAEHASLLHAAGDGEPGCTSCYPDLFERAVSEHPDHVAVRVVDGQGPLTYRELDSRANQLAHVLKSLGAGPDERVALCLPRSVDFVIAVLAVLKAEAAYVPLDPTYPEDTLCHILTDSRASIVLTHEALVDGLPASGASVVVLDDDTRAHDQPCHAPARDQLSPSHLAYVIYTSGSSGVPKGVMVHHGAAVSHNLAYRSLTNLTQGDNVLQFASLSFDVSVEDVLPTLITGASLVLRSEAMSQSITAFLSAVKADDIHVLNLPAAFWLELVHHLERTGAVLPASVRLLITGGEKVSAQGHRTWSELAPSVRWLNGYGPTECAVTCTASEPASEGAPTLTDEVPIGRPLANARAYVTDPTGQLVPVGVPGELWVGGPCVATGYLGLDEQTAARFDDDPFTSADNARVFKTGDLVRWLPNGELEYLGRIDCQVKVRGFRIEPAAIEQTLESDPSVATAVATARNMGRGNQLVAWVLPAAGIQLDTTELEAKLIATLPRYLVPDAIVVLDNLPVKAGGKIDVDALPDPAGRAVGYSTHTARDLLDTRIAQIFANVLGCQRVDVDDSFFDLGGHSLHAIQLLDRIETETGVKITLPTLHAAPSPYAIADVVHHEKHHHQYEYLLPIQPEGTKPPIFGVHVLGENGQYFRPLARHLGTDQPLFGLGVASLEPDTNAPTAVPEIAAAYADEIEQCSPTGPVILAAVSLGSVVAMELAQQLLERGREVRMVALLDARGPGAYTPLPTVDRIKIHLRHLRDHGLAYLGEKVQDNLTAVRERCDVGRIRLYERSGRPVPLKLRVLQFIHANYAAQLSYEMAPYPGPLAIFCADEEKFWDPTFRRSGMGWSEVAVGPVHIVDVPGNHLSILSEPNVDVLADELEVVLANAWKLSK